MDVRIAHFPETRVVLVTHTGSPHREHDTARRLIAWKIAHRLLDPLRNRSYGLHYADPRGSDTARYRVDFCLSVDDPVPPLPEGFRLATIPPMRCAVARDVGSREDNRAARFLVDEWLPSSGKRQADYPAIFHYVNTGPGVSPRDAITDVYLPLATGYDAAMLENPLWYTLSGAHRRFSVGTDAARRYARGYSPIIGFPEPRRPDFAALAPYCEPGEQFWCEGWTSDETPEGWRVVLQRQMVRMVRDVDESLPPRDVGEDVGIIALDFSHAQRAVELAELTKPGPFGLRTLEYGDYWGVLEGERLVAMAGERFEMPGLREVSGICTHPAARGRGLAKRLTLKLLRGLASRGESAFLQVAKGNDAAHGLYRSLGFRDHSEPMFRIVERTAAKAGENPP